jgi:hypothetical protein
MTPRLAPLVAAVACAILGAGLASASAQAAAPVENPAGGKCFYMRDLRNHTTAPPRTLYLGVNGVFTYRLDMANDCLANQTTSDPIVIKTFGGSRTVCKPVDLEISGVAGHCYVSRMVRLSPQEAAALPKRLQP